MSFVRKLGDHCMAVGHVLAKPLSGYRRVDIEVNGRQWPLRSLTIRGYGVAVISYSSEHK